jgi:hypothetical protein
VLRRIFGPKRKEDESWRKLHNDELHSLYSSPNTVRVIKSRRMRGRDMWHAWGRGEVFTGVLVGRLEGKRPLGKLTRMWESNITMDLRKIGIDEGNCIQLA